MPPRTIRAQGPTLVCGRVGAFDHAALAQAREAFHGAPAYPLGQAWLPRLEPGFRSASVRTGWRGDRFLVFAEMTDDDVFSSASRPNQRCWELGDCFEIFLQAENAPWYAEFHVTPNNQRLQLRIPVPRPEGRPPEEMLVEGAPFESRAWIGEGGWQALAVIPYACAGGRPRRASFGRYDYTRGLPEPVLSSTSPHARRDFHRREEWGMLRFEPSGS